MFWGFMLQTLHVNLESNKEILNKINKHKVLFLTSYK